jgi:hypothetical protein
VLAVLSSGAETKTLIAGTYSIVGDTTSQTLTNKTLTAPTLTSPVINTGVSGTAVESTLTGTASILTTSAGIKTYVDNKWKVMSSVTRSDYKTFTSTTSILAGASLKYTNGSSTVYGIVVSVSGGPTYTYTIAGPDFPSGGTAAVSYCYNNTVEKTFVFSGLCLTATTNTLIATFNKSGYLWRHAPGYLVKTSAYLGTRLVTSPIINLRIGSSNVMTTGLTIAAGTTWYNSEDVGTASDIISANYSVVYSNNVEVAVTTASATSTDLTVSLLFVLS